MSNPKRARHDAPELVNLPDDVEAGQHRTLSIVLVRLGMPEHRE